MKTSEYWAQRFTQLENAQHQIGVQTLLDIEKAHIKAERELEAQISTWYQRFADNNEITLAEAKQYLNGSDLKELKWDIAEYIKHGEENALDGRWMKELENASAKYHISRLEALKIRSRQTLEMLANEYLGDMNDGMADVYRSGYYHSIFEMQKGMGIGFDIASVDPKQIEKIISKPWAVDGKNFSSRIWDNKNKLINTIHQDLTQGIMLGQDPAKTIDIISRKMNTSKNNAGRLVMTEEAYFSSLAQKDAFKELDVERFEIVATLDSHTSEMCRTMDGKVFEMKDYEPGTTAPPFHVYCRSTTVPYFEDDYGVPGERAARSEDGKLYYVPANMTYRQWEKKFVGGGKKTGLKTADPGDIVKAVESIKELVKLKKSGMKDSDYNAYLDILNDHDNPDIVNIYRDHADEIESVKCGKKGYYQKASNSLMFDYPKFDDMNKYGTLAHEYGHFFDSNVSFKDLNFSEIEAVQDATGLDMVFPKVASSSDEFLEAVRKDKEHLKSVLSSDIENDLVKHNASSGVQDAIDGLFSRSRIRWGHGERYYNRKYSRVSSLDRISSRSQRKKKLQQVYKDLGLDASNQSKTKAICRQYEAASEMWANIMSAEVCGGDSLKYVKLYLPNSYQAFLKIIKGAKK